MCKALLFLATLLLIYTAISSSSYSNYYSTGELFSKFGGLFIVIAILIVFNAVLHWSYIYKDYLWRHKINNFVNVQLVVDLVCALAFVHFSGGILSWFWTLLLLYTIELTYFLPILRTILTYGGVSLGIYTILVFGEYFEFIPPVKLLFLKSNLQANLNYILIVWFFVITVNVITAFVSFNFRVKEEPSFADRANRDTQTKLYNRKRFNDFLNSEVFRAQRYKRVISLAFFKVNNLEQLLNEAGIKEADKILGKIGTIFKNNLRRSDTTPSYDIDIACRYDGDIFAIILPETPADKAVIPAQRIDSLIKHEVKTASKDVKVTLNIGISDFLNNSSDSKSIIKVAF